MNERIQNVERKLFDWGIDALIIENKIDLFYLTGLTLSAGKLLISKNSQALVVDSRYDAHARQSVGIPVVLDTEDAFRDLIRPFAYIGFDGASLSWDRVEGLMVDYERHHWKSISSPLKMLRAIKDEEEIQKMKKAADLGSLGFDFLKSLLKEGIQEKELASKLDLFWKERGGKGFAFEPIIAFGEKSAYPHYHAGEGRLKKGDPVLIDIGVVFEGYHSDMTRTLFFGEPDPKLKEIYSIVLEAQTEALKITGPEATCGALDNAARHIIEENGFGDSFKHSLGHGVGLEIHEWPLIKNKMPYASIPLKENMCVTIEPGIYVPGLGGVRIEDTVHITHAGNESLTKRPSSLGEAILNA